MLLLGPVSSLFDFTTFAVLWFAFGYRNPTHAPLFRTAWFTESLLTQTLVIHVIRTDRIPCLQSRASPGLIATTAAGPRKCPASIPPGRAAPPRRARVGTAGYSFDGAAVRRGSAGSPAFLTRRGGGPT